MVSWLSTSSARSPPTSSTTDCSWTFVVPSGPTLTLVTSRPGTGSSWRSTSWTSWRSTRRSSISLLRSFADRATEQKTCRPRSADLQLFGRDADVHLDAAADDADRIGVHREHRRQGAHLAGDEVEPRAVARALDKTVLELPLPEHAAVVRAHVVDRAPGPVLTVTEAETLRPGPDDPDLARRYLVLAGDGDEFGHAIRARPSPRCCRCAGAPRSERAGGRARRPAR